MSPLFNLNVDVSMALPCNRVLVYGLSISVEGEITGVNGRTEPMFHWLE